MPLYQATGTSLSHVIGSSRRPIVGRRSGSGGLHVSQATPNSVQHLSMSQLAPPFCITPRSPIAMSARLWPTKQSILPVIPTTPITIRLNLDCHKLNHPTRKQLFRDPPDDGSITKPNQEQVLSRRKDHTVPTRWSLYRPLIRFARQVDSILASRRLGSLPSDTFYRWDYQRPDRVLTRHIRCRWRRKQSIQGYQRMRDWLSVEYEVCRSARVYIPNGLLALNRIGIATCRFAKGCARE